MRLNQGETLAVLADMDGHEFEHLVADLWEHQGWNTRVTRGSNDRGVDVIAEKHSPFYEKQLIQAKCFARGNKVGSPEIQQYSSLRHQEDNVDAVIVVTTSSFSRQAKEIANDLNVKLVDGDTLYNLITTHAGEDFLKQYVDLPSSTANTDNGDRQDVTTRTHKQESSNDDDLPEIEEWDFPNNDETEDSSLSLLKTLADTIESKSSADRAPYGISKSAYHNENWKKIKLAIALPICIFIVYLVAAITRSFMYGPYGDITFSSTPILHIILVLFTLSLLALPVIFVVYASRDKKHLSTNTQYARPRHPLTIAVFLVFSYGIYAVYYLMRRVTKYQVEENNWKELNP